MTKGKMHWVVKTPDSDEDGDGTFEGCMKLAEKYLRGDYKGSVDVNIAYEEIDGHHMETVLHCFLSSDGQFFLTPLTSAATNAEKKLTSESAMSRIDQGDFEELVVVLGPSKILRLVTSVIDNAFDNLHDMTLEDWKDTNMKKEFLRAIEHEGKEETLDLMSEDFDRVRKLLDALEKKPLLVEQSGFVAEDDGKDIFDTFE